MKRLGIALVSASLTAAALGGCSLLPGGTASPADQLDVLLEASGADGVYFAQTRDGDVTAILHVGGEMQAWSADEGGEPSQIASGSGVESVDIPAWSPGAPLEWFMSADAARDSFALAPECSEVLSATLEAVGAGHQLAWFECTDVSNPPPAAEQIPTYYYDGAQVEPGTWDLTDPAQLGEAVAAGIEAIGDTEAAGVLLELEGPGTGGAGSLQVAGLSESTSAAGDVCQPLFHYEDTIAAMSVPPYSTGCNDVTPNFLPVPVPFDPELALRLWTDAGGTRDAFGSIQYWVDPDFGIPMYVINVEGQPNQYYYPDGTEFTL